MDSTLIIFGLMILIMSVIVHEVSHGYVANILGDPTAKLAGRLTLNPVSHLDAFGSVIVPLLSFMIGGFIFGWAKPVPFNPYNLKGGKWGPAYVAVAGPLSNFFIAIIFALIIRAGVAAEVLSASFVELGLLVVQINVALGVINLIPIPPIDGSKLLFAVLPYQYRKIEEYIVRYQLILIFIIIFFGWQFVAGPIVGITTFLLGG